MIKKKNKKLGFSLVEIMVALSIFALLAVPAYVMFSYSASEETAFHQTAAANRILESYRDETKSLGFEYVKADLKSGNNLAYTSLPPKTGQIFLKEHDSGVFNGCKVEINVEKKIMPQDSDGNSEPVEIISFKVTVKWTNRRNSEKSESLSFVKVK